jgi:hypothetical protein
MTEEKQKPLIQYIVKEHRGRIDTLYYTIRDTLVEECRDTATIQYLYKHDTLYYDDKWEYMKAIQGENYQVYFKHTPSLGNKVYVQAGKDINWDIFVVPFNAEFSKQKDTVVSRKQLAKQMARGILKNEDLEMEFFTEKNKRILSMMGNFTDGDFVYIVLSIKNNSEMYALNNVALIGLKQQEVLYPYIIEGWEGQVNAGNELTFVLAFDTFSIKQKKYKLSLNRTSNVTSDFSLLVNNLNKNKFVKYKSYAKN